MFTWYQSQIKLLRVSNFFSLHHWFSNLHCWYFQKPGEFWFFWQNFCFIFLLWPSLLQSFLNLLFDFFHFCQKNMSEILESANQHVSSPTSTYDVINTTTGELQNIQLGLHLNGKNYLKWSLFVQTFLKGKGNWVIFLGEDWNQRTQSLLHGMKKIPWWCPNYEIWWC